MSNLKSVFKTYKVVKNRKALGLGKTEKSDMMITTLAERKTTR